MSVSDGVRAVVGKEATPPLRSAVPSEVDPLKNSTVPPAGAATEPASGDVIVAVSVTDCPVTDALGCATPAVLDVAWATSTETGLELLAEKTPPPEKSAVT